MYRLTLLFPLILLFSCSTVTDPNKNFNEKYSPQVKSILSSVPAQNQEKNSTVKDKTQFGNITYGDVIDDQIRDDHQFYPYFDVRKFGQTLPKVHLPDMAIYDQTRFQNPSNQLPPDIFEVTYETRLYPPFKYQGARFDSIHIPRKDIYGVETTMTNKDYLLAGNDSVQNSIENIKRNKKSYDVQNTNILIAEQKKLRHERKIAKLFGSDVVKKEN